MKKLYKAPESDLIVLNIEGMIAASMDSNVGLDNGFDGGVDNILAPGKDMWGNELY